MVDNFFAGMREAEANKMCTFQQSMILPHHASDLSRHCHVSHPRHVDVVMYVMYVPAYFILHQSKPTMVGTNSSRDNRITLVSAASFAAGVVVASVVFRRREKRRRKVSRLNGEQTVVMT